MKKAKDYIKEKRLATISKDKIAELMEEYAGDLLKELEETLSNMELLTPEIKYQIARNIFSLNKTN